MSRRTKSPLGRPSERQLRGDDSCEDLRRYQECAKKLDECSKNLLRLCQVTGELGNLHDNDIERAANEIMRTEEEEAKKIAAELLHQKGMLNRNQQDPDCGPHQEGHQRPRSGGVGQSNAREICDGQIKKEPLCTDQSHHQVINDPPYSIVHKEERVPCTPSQGHQYVSNSGTSLPSPCTDRHLDQQPRPHAYNTAYDIKQGDGQDRRGPPYFRKCQQQPPQTSWRRPEPVWNQAVTRKADKLAGSNPRLLDPCNEETRKMDCTTVRSAADTTNSGMKPQTIRLTAGPGHSSDPPVHIVITAITNDCQAAIDNLAHQRQAYSRDPVYSDNDFADESVFSIGNKCTPTGDDRTPRYLRQQQKLVDRGCDAFDCPDDATRILNCALKCWEKTKNNLRSRIPPQTNCIRNLQCQEPRSQTKGFSLNLSPLNSSTECDQSLQNASAAYSQCKSEVPLKTFTASPCSSREKLPVGKCASGMRPGNKDLKNPAAQRILLNCCPVTAEAKRKPAGSCCDGLRQYRPSCCPVDVGEALRQFRTPITPSPCIDRQSQCGQKPNQSQFASNLGQLGGYQRQFSANQTPCGVKQQYQCKTPQSSQPCGQQYNVGKSSQPCGQQYQYDECVQPRVPQQSTSVPKTYKSVQICPPSSTPITLQCAPSSTVNRSQSVNRMRNTASEMDSSILLAIAKAAINLSLESQRGECQDDEYEDDCDSESPDLLDTIFED